VGLAAATLGVREGAAHHGEAHARHIQGPGGGSLGHRRKERPNAGIGGTGPRANVAKERAKDTVLRWHHVC